MDNKNLDGDSTDNSANFTNSAEALRKFGNIADNGKEVLTIKEKAIMEYYAEIERKEKRTKKQVKAIEVVTNDLLHFAGSLSTGGADGFSGLTAAIDATVGIAAGFASAVPFVGEQLKEMAQVIGDLGKFLVNQFKSAYGKFEKLSDTGVVTTFEDLKEISDSTGLNLEDINKVFGKFSTDIALFGGSATTGRKAIQELLFDSDKISRNFQNLGMSIDQVAEFQISALAQSKLSSDFDINDTKKNVSFTSQYILSIDTLSKLTGKGRKELQEEILARGKGARYTAGIGTLPAEIKQQADAAISLLSVIGPKTFGEGISDIIATNGAPITEKSRIAMMNLEEGGMNVRDSVLKLKRGEMSGIEFNNMARKAMARFAQSNKEQIKVSASGLKVYENINAGFDALINVEEDSNKTTEELIAAQNAIINATKGTGESLSETQRSMYAISKNLTMLITSSDIVAGAMNTVADAMNKTTQNMYELIGKKLPAELKARFEETASLTELNKEKNKFNKLTVQLTQNEQKLLKLKENPKSDPREIKTLQDQNVKDKKETELLNTQIEARQQQLDIIKKDRIEKENMAKYGQKTNPNAPAGSPPPSGGGGNAGSAPSINSSSSGSFGRGTAETEKAGGMKEGSGPTTVGQNQQLLLQEMNDLGVTDSKTRAAMAAMAEGESGFKLQSEISYENTPNQGIRKSFGPGSVFGKMSDDQLTRVKKDPVQFFDIVYGGRYGNTSPGDGYKYRGRGFIGITFKDNYAKYGKLLGIDLVGNPDLANDPKIAAKIAVMMMKDGMANNKGVYGNADIYTQVARSIGNANKVTEQGKKDAYARNLQTGQWGQDKTADLNFMNGQPVPSSVATGNIIPKSAVGSSSEPSGILKGPSTGYLVVLHGDEMVIPANEGSQKLQLQGMMSNSIDQESVVKLFSMINKKVDMMISSVESSISNQMSYKNMRVA